MSGHENGSLKIVIKYVCVGKKKSEKNKNCMRVHN
jgi:hypothetical protein